MTSSWRAIVLLTAGVLLPSTALAWRHLGWAWADDQLPIELRVADDGADNSIEACAESKGLSGCCEEDLAPGTCIDAAADAVDRWLAPRCVELPTFVADGRADASVVAPNDSPMTTDGINAITFNSPGVALPAGVLAITTTTSASNSFSAVIGGRAYERNGGTVDITFASGVAWSTNEQIETGDCANAFSFESVMSHEMGHLLGVGHSCEAGESCAHPLLRSALMYYQTSSCVVATTEPNADDLGALQALYGPSLSIQCSRSTDDGFVLGVAPLPLTCTAIPVNGLELDGEPVWDMGDGTERTGTTIDHTYQEAGLYGMRVAYRGTGPGCDSGVDTVEERPASVRVCDENRATFEAVPDGLRIELRNETDLSAYGCVTDVRWDVTETATGRPVAGPIDAWETTVVVPEPGDYTVMLQVGGPAGTAAAEALVPVTGEPATSCSHGAAALGWGWLLFTGLLARRTRSRASAGRRS